MSFLYPSIKQIRHSIKDIDDSYNNPWDIIAELCQNAVDAIRKSDVSEGLIKISVNCLTKEVTVYDNGVGIPPTKLPELLKPFSGDKVEDEETIGEKGVGLTFTMFSCNEFYTKGGTTEGVSIGEVKEAYNWKNRNDDEELNLTHKQVQENFRGTEVILRKVEEAPLFNLTFEQFKYVLRTKTAIGSTMPIWGDERNVKVELTFTDLNNVTTQEIIPFNYWLIYEGIPSQNIIDLAEFVNYAKSADITDLEKRKKLRDKIIYSKGQFKYSNNRIIEYIAFFVPKRGIWDQLSVHHKLCTTEDLENDKWLDDYGYILFQNGIFTSVKGMPTGISVDHPTTGYAGYWSNIFILFEDRHLRFDIGRKSIHGMQGRLYREYARRIFNDFLKYVTKYVSGDVQPPPDWDKDETFAEILKLLDLNVDGIKLVKSPKYQEASVAALFFECVGNGKISQIVPLTAGYRSKYDLYAKWGNKNIVIEFKSQLSNILKDFKDEQKLFNEIDCVVCWDVGEDDKQRMKDKGIDLEELQPSFFGGPVTSFPHATHQLLLSGFVSPVYVIDLKRILGQI